VSAPVYEFGPFRFDAAQRLLFRGEATVPLMPKAADTLLALLEDHGRVVEKAELMRRVWPDTHVDEIGLARNISLLRKTLGGEEENASYIETIPKRGYRFVAEVRRPALTPPPAPHGRRWRWWLTGGILLAALLIYWQFYAPSRYLPSGGGRVALAVAPFTVMPDNESTRSFERGFTEVLTAELAGASWLEVTSPSTVRRYQALGIPMSLMTRILVLPVIVEGVIQDLGEQVRITVRLSDVHSGKLIWANTYDRPRNAELEVAATVAAEVARKLKQ